MLILFPKQFSVSIAGAILGGSKKGITKVKSLNSLYRSSSVGSSLAAARDDQHFSQGEV